MRLAYLCHPEPPALIRDCAQTDVLRRLREVGMNCGCEYTSFPRFRGLAPYSRFDHSLGAALIVWQFTRDPAQTAAALLHDVATPVFAHVVDFLRGDYLRQEATEDGTAALIENSAELRRCLREHGLRVDEVCDYHRYPIADNDPPRLSADRLEYSLGNILNFGFASEKEAAAWYADLAVGKNEDGAEELLFRTRAAAEGFAEAALRCSEVYVSPEDRYAMQRLAELLREALSRGVLKESDLYTTEPAVIAKLQADPATAAQWRDYRALRRMRSAAQAGPEEGWRRIRAKKRCIDPLVKGLGRLSGCSPAFAVRLEAFLSAPQDEWLLGSPD